MHMYNFILNTMTYSEINVQYRYNYDPTNIQFIKYNKSNTQYIYWTRSYTDNAVLSVDIYKHTINNTNTNITNCPGTILQTDKKYKLITGKLPLARQPISNNIVSTLLVLYINIKLLKCKRPSQQLSTLWGALTNVLERVMITENGHT